MTANQINFAKLREEQRHNAAMESQGIQTLSESNRHNVRTEEINWFKANSDKDIGLGQVGIGMDRNAIQSDFNTAKIAEENRHNTETEHRAKVGQYLDAASTFVRTVVSALPGIYSLSAR